MNSRTENRIENLLVLFAFIALMGALCFVLINVAYSSENSRYFDNGEYETLSNAQSITCVKDRMGRFLCTARNGDDSCSFELEEDLLYRVYVSNRNEKCETEKQSKQEETL